MGEVTACVRLSCYLNKCSKVEITEHVFMPPQQEIMNQQIARMQQDTRSGMTALCIETDNYVNAVSVAAGVSTSKYGRGIESQRDDPVRARGWMVGGLAVLVRGWMVGGLAVLVPGMDGWRVGSAGARGWMVGGLVVLVPGDGWLEGR